MQLTGLCIEVTTDGEQITLINISKRIGVGNENSKTVLCKGRLNTWLSNQRISSRNANYLVLYNYFKAEKSYECLQSITFTTHGEFQFMENLIPLIEKWQGPLSVAVFAPGKDFERSYKIIEYYRNCEERSHLVSKYATFHFFFPTNHMPETLKNISFSCDEILTYHLKWKSYRRGHSLDYPINVARMIARESATTHFVLAADIELYPSSNFIPKFLKMIEKQGFLENTVYVLPIFEIQDGEEFPENKTKLVTLYDQKKVIIFHEHFCPSCHMVPNFENWMNDLPVLQDELKGHP